MRGRVRSIRVQLIVASVTSATDRASNVKQLSSARRRYGAQLKLARSLVRQVQPALINRTINIFPPIAFQLASPAMPEPDPADADDGAERTSEGDGGNRFQVLGYEQVNRLHRLMDTEVPIHGRGNFPTLEIKLRDLVQVVRNNLKQEDINVRDIRLNGGAASFILGNETSEVWASTNQRLL